LDSDPAPWDPFSEQPYPIRQRLSKLARLRFAFADYAKSILTLLVCLPLLAAFHVALATGYRPANWSRPQRRAKEFMGLAIALNSCDGPRQAYHIRDLGVKHLLLRIPVWEADDLGKYTDFITSLPECEFAVCVMQDRQHVLDPELWRTHLRTIVEECWPRVRHFQVGQAMNRSKWGCFKTAEYLALASIAEELRAEFPGIQLIGPGILDFETLPLLRSLIHGFPVQWDAVGCGLYVDRRGSPRNRQLLLFNLRHKILHFAACIRFSPKAGRRFWVTEVNWPLSNTAPYSPTCERDCVSEEDAATYLAEYYVDAWDSQLVERVYWWQLVARGFGLIDVDADQSLRLRPAYHAFKGMLQTSYPQSAAAYAAPAVDSPIPFGPPCADDACAPERFC